MDKHQIKITILACLLISGILVFFGLNPRKGVSNSPSYPPPIANAQGNQQTSVGSPDGKFTLDMKEDKGKDTVTYTFLMKDESSGSQKEIYTKTVPAGTTLSIPYNTFSPDNKFIFIKETGSSQTSYFALTTSGAPIAKDAQSFDISSLFRAKYSNYNITEVTGWGGMTLIVVNTDKIDGAAGPSFWFDVSSGSFIQLSRRFD